MQTEMTAYERDLAERAKVADLRHGLAVAAASTLAGYLTGGGTTIWRVDLIKQDYGHDRIVVTNGHGVIQVHPGGYGKEHRLCAYVPTTRYVQFGPGDFDTVHVKHDRPTEATVNEHKDALTVAKEFARKLGSVALNVADALDAEQARMSALRDKGYTVFNEFTRAGWKTSDRHGEGYVWVPEDHALYALGVYALKVNLKTGEVTYSSTPYLRSTTAPAALIGLKF